MDEQRPQRGDHLDTATHALIGLILGELAPKDIKHRRLIGLSFGMLPDITNVLLVHPYLGWLAGRSIPFALGIDFINFPEILDHWTYHVWLLSHSLLFWAVVFGPIWKRNRTVQLASIAYLSHVLADIPSHTGAYGLEPFYPIPYVFDGWFDAWLWGPGFIAASIASSLFVYLIVRKIRINWLLWPSERDSTMANNGAVDQ